MDVYILFRSITSDCYCPGVRHKVVHEVYLNENRAYNRLEEIQIVQKTDPLDTDIYSVETCIPSDMY